MAESRWILVHLKLIYLGTATIAQQPTWMQYGNWRINDSVPVSFHILTFFLSNLSSGIVSYITHELLNAYIISNNFNNLKWEKLLL
jgi:hypothetical protein